MNWAEYKQKITVLSPSEKDQIEIIAQLVHRRKQQGLTQKELGNLSGLKQEAIARLEKENSIPRLDTLEKVSKALGLKIVLVEEDDNTKNETKILEHV